MISKNIVIKFRGYDVWITFDDYNNEHLFIEDGKNYKQIIAEKCNKLKNSDEVYDIDIRYIYESVEGVVNELEWLELPYPYIATKVIESYSIPTLEENRISYEKKKFIVTLNSEKVESYVYNVIEANSYSEAKILFYKKLKEKQTNIRDLMISLGIDDNPINLKFMKEILKRLGADIILARSGDEALEYIKERGRVDFIFVDKNMPVMDGYETIREIRKIEKSKSWEKIVIIALTGDSDDETIKQMAQAGADDILLKPIHINQLIKKVNYLTLKDGTSSKL